MWLGNQQRASVVTSITCRSPGSKMKETLKEKKRMDEMFIT